MSERTLTRADLAESVYEQVGLSRNESSDLVEQVRAAEGDHRLRVHVGEQGQRPILPAAAHDVAERVHRRRIDGRHVSHADDQDLRILPDLAEGVLELLRRAEEEGAIDLVHDDAGRYVAATHRDGIVAKRRRS